MVENSFNIDEFIKSCSKLGNGFLEFDKSKMTFAISNKKYWRKNIDSKGS